MEGNRLYEPYGFVEGKAYYSLRNTIDEEIKQNRETDKEQAEKSFTKVEFDEENNNIVFSNSEDKAVGLLNVDDIVPSYLIEDVTYDKDTQILTIKFDSEHIIEVDLNDLITVDEAGDGLEIKDSKISIKIAEDSDNFIQVSSEGLKSTGVQEAIDEEKERAVAEEERLNNLITAETESREAMADDISANTSNISELNENVTEHTANTELHVTSEEKNLWNNKLDETALSGYATEQWVGEQGYLTEHQSLSGYATLAEVDEKDDAVKALIPTVPTNVSAFVNDANYLTEHQSLSGYATEQWVEGQGYLTEHQDLSDYATIEIVDEKDNAVKALIPTVPTNVSAFVNDANYLTEHQSLSGYATEQWVNEQGFLTEHQDISNLATKAEVEAEVARATAEETKKVDKEIVTNGNKALIFNESDGGGAKFEHSDGTWSFAGVNDGGENGIAGQIYALKKNEENKMEGTRIDVTKGAMYYTVGADTASDRMVPENEIAVKGDFNGYYSQEEVDTLIRAKETEIYNLTKIVGELGGNVTYDLPNELGTSFNSLMNNNGTVKLADDVTTSRFGPGIFAKNKVKLNLNNHNLTVTGLTLTSATAAVMARGTQEITISGKGTIDSGQGMCIEGYGADSVINLTGSTTVYQNDRSGGELVYCYAGTINITNGTFRNNGEEKKFMLNCYDANYRNGTAKIIVSGGKFYDFDPGDNSAEGEHTSFLAEGYYTEASTVVEEGVEHTVYTVKKTQI